MDLTPYLSSRLPTIDAIKAVINARSGSWYPSWRLLLLDQNLQPVPLPNPTDKNHPNDLSEFVMACSMKVDASQDVVRTMDLQLREEPGLQLNTLMHRIQVRSVWWDGQGNELLDVPMGTFRAGLPDRSFEDAIVTWSGTWQDLSGKIADKTFWNEYVSPAGIVGTDLIRNLMLADPKPLSRGGSATPAGCDHIGIGWPAALLDVTPSSIILPDPIDWTWKDNQMAALKQITNIINFWPGWNVPNGLQAFKPNPYQYIDESGGGMPEPDWTYEYGEDSIITGPIVVKYPNPITAKNAIRVISENNSRNTITATYFNDSIDSLISTVNYGDYVPLVIEDSQIPDQATANARVKIEAQAAGMPQQEIDFPAHVNPFLDIHDFIDVHFNAQDGTPEIQTDLYPYEVKSITTDLFTRESQIVAQRVISLGAVV